MLILIWGDSQAKSMIFFDYDIPFFASVSHFLAKIEFLRIHNPLYFDLMVVRTWFLIQEKSGVANFSKNENLKKGAKGGATNYVWVYTMTISKNANLTSETATRASYHGTNDRNQYS